MGELILLLRCGQTVIIHNSGGLRGMITCQSLRFDKIQYEITYYSDGDQHCIWANENEFKVEAKEVTQKIGFK